MSSKDDKHLKLIEECRWLSSSSDSLKKYQTKITKLANSLRKDILQEDVRDLFTQAELEAIESAAAALSNFKNTVTHAKEYKAREERRHKALQDKMQKQALELVLKNYSYAGTDTIGKLRFILAGAQADDRFKYESAIDDINWRVSDDGPGSPEKFPVWVENTYRRSVRDLAGRIVGWYDTELNAERMEAQFDRVNKALQQVTVREKKRLEELAWYIAKHSAEELSEADKKSLGL